MAPFVLAAGKVIGGYFAFKAAQTAHAAQAAQAAQAAAGEEKAKEHHRGT